MSINRANYFLCFYKGNKKVFPNKEHFYYDVYSGTLSKPFENSALAILSTSLTVPSGSISPR